MAERDDDDINLEIHTRVKELNLYIKEMDKKINKLMTLKDSTESDDEVEALKAGIEALKKDQEDVKKIYNELVIEFDKPKDFGGFGISTDIEGQKEEDNVDEGLIELQTRFVLSVHTSDVDLEISPSIEGHQQDMPGLISDSEESEKETEEFKKSGGDVKRRFLEKLTGADSSDDLEEVSSDAEDLSTNIQELEQEMRELMNGSGKSEGSKKERGSVKKLNEVQKSRNSRLEKVISDQSGYIDLAAYTSIKGLKRKIYGLMHEERKTKKGGNVKKSDEAQKSRNSRFEKVISDQSGYIDLNAYTSIKGLKGKIYGLMHEERKSKGTLIDYGQFDNVEGLVQKMCAWMHERKEGLEKDQHVVNKRLKGFPKECDESDEEWKALKATKARTIELATKLSLQVVDLMFFMSERKEVLANFQEVKDLLQWVNEDENSLVLSRIISVMELVDEEVRKMKETEKVKSESLEESSVNAEEIDQFIEQFIKEVLRLEYIFKPHGLPESQMLKKQVLTSLEVGLEECEKELRAIEMKLNELKAMSSFMFRSDGSEINENWKRAVELKINELWTGLEGADEEKEERELMNGLELY